MENRWFHKPKLHIHSPHEERKASWLELFYDLIYVATIIQLGNGLSGNIGWFGFIAFAGLFAPLWQIWTAVTYFTNRFKVDDVLHRLMVLVQMFFVGTIAWGIPGVFSGDPTLFIWGIVGAKLIVVLLFLRAGLQADEARDLGRWYSVGHLLSAACWVGSLFVPEPWNFLLWALAVLIDIVVPLNRHSREIDGKYPLDIEYMSERFGLLVIIVLGESFVKILSAVADAGASLNVGLMWGMTLMITASLWWIYFDDVAGSRIKEKVRGSNFIWFFAHMPFTIAVTAVGVANKKVAFFDPFAPAPIKYAGLLCGTLGLAFFTVAVIDYVTERQHSEVSDRSRVMIRLGSAGAILLFGFVANNMDAISFIGIIAVFCLLQVVFDLFAAPEMLSEDEAEHHPTAPAHHGDRPENFRKLPRRDVTDAVRIGAPNELRRDLYFQFMSAGWTATFVAFVALFLVTNVIFAAIYTLDPGGISSVRPNSFVDAFYFSVQTLTTIGYGTMSPMSDFAHTVVTIESALGILGVAIATGVFFAKASRPSASVVFSEPIVIAKNRGVPMLTFRVGNARGNEVVEASMRVVALIAEVTPEGEHFRRLIDLKLVRDTTPLFSLSWTVMHPIDEDSPLYGMTNQTIHDELFGVICTMMGYDATYGQHTHARHLYYPENIYFDRRFVDTTKSLEDGRIQIDYRKFHDTVPLADVSGEEE